ncbi:MAG: class I SAM-dependent methyltransferase [Verrucomicrobia bacterium]|nr:class I SAM-dependent methyltransferase [Verrucomicrobiota bacterium]
MYGALNQAVLARVPSTANRVLDLGCGTGVLGRALKERQPCAVVGVTFSPEEAAAARAHLDQVLVRDLNRFEPGEVGRVDCVICSHVLEHLYHPDQLLRQLHACLAAEGRVVVALPNVLFWRQRLEFCLGRFRYAEGGLMDRTHYRFFDWETAGALLAQTGYGVESAEAEGALPGSRFLAQAGRWLDQRALELSPGLFGFQFIFVARPAATQPASG